MSGNVFQDLFALQTFLIANTLSMSLILFISDDSSSLYIKKQFVSSFKHSKQHRKDFITFLYSKLDANAKSKCNIQYFDLSIEISEIFPRIILIDSFLRELYRQSLFIFFSVWRIFITACSKTEFSLSFSSMFCSRS